MKTIVLYFGDNLEILRKYIPDNSVDLIYLDPPLIAKQPITCFIKNRLGSHRKHKYLLLKIPGNRSDS